MDPGWNTTHIRAGKSPYECTLLYRAIPVALRISAGEKRAIRAFSQELAEFVTNGYSFTCLITNDVETRRLNRAFLDHDYPTDVLSFPSVGGSGLGEIAISAQRASAQARAFGHSRLDEIKVLMLHGVLHLAGLDHERDRGAMARVERKWRKEFALPSSLIARSSSVEADR